MTVWNADWLDSQYNNRTRVPEHPEILDRWARSSELARSELSCELDVAYGDTSAETLDVFPAAAEGSPILFFIHGGYWRALDKRDVSFVAPAFVKAGAAVVVPNYGLCPSVDIPTIALQMVRALVWAWRNASSFGGDPRRIVVAGHSAGGHLATMMLCCDWRSQGSDIPETMVSSALSISGLYDLEPVAQVGFLQQDLRLTPALVDLLSPVRFPAPQRPLVCAVGGDETDEFLRHNLMMRAAWGPAVVPNVEHVPGTNHFTVLHALVDHGQRLHRIALELLGLPVGADPIRTGA